MDRNQALQQVIGAIHQVREFSGKGSTHVDPNTRPLRDLVDFDSLSGVEAAVLLSESVGIDLPDHLFTGSKGQRVPSIGEIADIVIQATQSGSTRNE